MADSARRRRAISAARRVENDALRLENETLRVLVSDLEAARRSLIDLIAASPSDWQVIHAKGLVTALDAQLAAWQGHAVTQLGTAYTTAAGLGVRQTVDPLTAGGIDLVTRPVIPQTIVATAYQTLPDLITDVRRDTVAKVGSVLRQAVLGGLTPADAMRLVGRIVGPAARGPFRNAALRSEFIVRTELGRILQQAAYASAQDLARYDANAGLMSEWVTAGDSRVRHDHAAASGQRVPVGGEFHIGGYAAKYPHDPRLPAKESIGCRCRILPYHPDWGPDVGPKVRADIDARLGRTKTAATGRVASDEGGDLALTPAYTADELLAEESSARELVVGALPGLPETLSWPRVAVGPTRDNAAGQYDPATNAITIHPNCQYPFVTATHELAHFLDSRALSPGGAYHGYTTLAAVGYLDRAESAIAKIRRDYQLAGMDSEVVRVDDAARAADLLRGWWRAASGSAAGVTARTSLDRKTRYRGEPHEVWARSVLQWLAATTRDDRLERWIGFRLDDGLSWDAEDFADIKAELDRILGRWR